MDGTVIAQIIVSGSLMGLIYSLVAYGFQLTFATSKSINFGQLRSYMEKRWPGPRGSPHDPQPPGPLAPVSGIDDFPPPELATAKVESWRTTSSPEHLGQAVPPSPKDSFS